MTDDTTPSEPLLRLADMHGVQTVYRDVDDRPVHATTDALLATLRALGVPVDDPGDAAGLIDLADRDRWRRRLEPVVATFDGHAVPVDVRLPAGEVGTVRLELVHESGETHRWDEDLGQAEAVGGADVDRTSYLARRLWVRDLPHGYHRLTVEVAGERAETLLVNAPPQAYVPEGRTGEWGAFIPLYALRTARDWGAGDLTDLGALAALVDDRGGALVGTLPLLPVYVGGRTGAGAADEPFDPSPYNPVSRLFWNELVCDLTAAPELAHSPEAREILGSRAFDDEVAALRALHHVDWRRVAALKGRVLRALTGAFQAGGDDRRADLDRYLDARPIAAEYARFRGAVARHGARWWDWATSDLDSLDVDEETMRVHLYAQMLAQEQVSAFSADLRARGQHPYLDLPVGTAPEGFDVFRFRDVFARDADTGAPPDAIFTGGQNWHFPPLHPARVREDGYRYPIEVLRHHLALADDLRIDHVMGLHRLYWIPHGVDASDGTYVSYPADEWYAILLLESHRHRSRIVGENLGTVPPYVEEALERRGIVRMYVVQYEAQPNRYEVLDKVPADTIASVNTHDMPPFHRWWTGRDAADGIDLGLADEEDAERARRERARIRENVVSLLTDAGLIDRADGEDPRAVLAGLVAWLGESDAPMVLVNLEDLWLEDEPQNVPGTIEERPNWTRRAGRTLDEIRGDGGIDEILRRLDEARRRERGR